MLRVLALCSLAFVLACDRDWQSPSAPGRLEAATPPSVVGSYNATWPRSTTRRFRAISRSEGVRSQRPLDSA